MNSLSETNNTLSNKEIIRLQQTSTDYKIITTIDSTLQQGGKFSSNMSEILLDSSKSLSINGPLLISNTIVNGDGAEITIINGSGNEFLFNSVSFIGVNIILYQSGNWTFKNCTFKNCKFSPIDIRISNIELTVEDCSFYDIMPDTALWNNNENSVRAWRFNPINLRSLNIKATIRRCSFSNVMAAHFIYIPANATGCYLYVEDCFFSNIYGNGICLEAKTSGVISKNYFCNIGALRGYKQYQHPNNGIGCNAIYSQTAYNDIDILDNYIINCVENGIEGIYKSISRNHIENTGYRYNEGFTTPSTEGIWGAAYLISDNTVINPYSYGITLQRGNFYIDGKIIVTKNHLINNSNTSSGIRFVINQELYHDCIVTDNSITGFNNCYEYTNPNNTEAFNIIIHDTNYEKTIDSVYSNMIGVKMTSTREINLPISNSKFNEIDSNNTLKGWIAKSSSLQKNIDNNGDSYGRITMLNKYGTLSQTFSLPTDTCILTLEMMVKSSTNNILVYVLCKDDNNLTLPPSDGGVYSLYKISLSTSSSEYTKKVITLKAKKYTTLGFYASSANQIIDIKYLEGSYFTDNGELTMN